MQIELNQFYIRLGSIGLILLLGFFLGKFKLITKKTNQEITNLLLVIFMPASLFVAFPSSYDEASASLFFSGLGAGFLIMALLVILAKIIFNKRIFKKDMTYESQFAFFLTMPPSSVIQSYQAPSARPAFSLTAASLSPLTSLFSLTASGSLSEKLPLN